jgi:FKBP-type peptidyl-prolyl cis-trans isomerase FklB
MKNILAFIAGLILLFPAQAQHTHTELNNELDSVSYAIGMNIASSFKAGGIDSLNFDVFLAGVKDILIENHAVLDENSANTVVKKYVSNIQKEASTAAIQEGADFLARNASAEGVTVTPSGLQYKVIRQGDGPKPTAASKVTTHYKGTLVNGKVFDSSYDRGTPTSFNVGGVIKGWTEALQMMPVGSKWILYIPQNLAYGERAVGANIPPYSTLIFEIELLSME